MTAKQAAEFLMARDNFLILTHLRPDGDTIGCAAGLCRALRRVGKEAYVLENPEATSLFTPYLEGLLARSGYEPKTVISVDIAARSLFPDNAVKYVDRVDLAIDHHPSFEAFGQQNIVRPEAGACGELVYDILRHLTAIDAEIALPLYVAIATDTGGFQFSNTTAYTHIVAAALMETGIDYRTVNKVFFRTKSRKRLALEADMLTNLEYFDRERVAFLYVPRSLMTRIQATESDAEELSSLGAQIQGVDCAVTFRELGEGEWKLSVRTGERVNATEVCRLMGGGGHARAAGCTVKAELSEVKRRCLTAIAANVPDFEG